MKSLDDLYARFESIHEPEISEETLGAYLEGNLDTVDSLEVEEAIQSSDYLTDLVSDNIDPNQLDDYMSPWIEEESSVVDDYVFDAPDFSPESMIVDYNFDDEILDYSEVAESEMDYISFGSADIGPNYYDDSAIDDPDFDSGNPDEPADPFDITF